MLVPQTLAPTAVGTANTTPANTMLAANANVNRWIREIRVTNTTTSAITLTVGIGAAAILGSSNSDVASALPIPANAASFSVVQFGGPQGRKALGAGSLNAIMAFASGAGLLMTVLYSDDSLSV